MTGMDSILVVVDRSEQAHAVFAKACILARHLHAGLELFTCDAECAYSLRHSYDQSGIHRALDAAVKDNKRFLDALRSSSAASDLDIQVNASCESPQYEGVVHEILTTRPDLVVKALATHDHEHNDWPGENDWHLVRTCPAPLLLTRGRVWRSTPRVAAFIDTSSHESPGLAERIARTAGALCTAINGQLELVHALRAGDDARSRAQLEALADSLGVAKPQQHLILGDPAHSLAEFARKQCFDVVALGALNHGAGAVSLVGTLTDKLIHALDSDFLLLKPESFRCPVQQRSN